MTNAVNTFPTLSQPVRLSRIPTTVDEVNVRLVAGLVLAVGVLALATGQYWLYLLLAADFVARALGGPRLSALARLVAGRLRPLVPAAPKPTAYAPKRFAAAIGAVLTVAASVLWLVTTTTGADLTVAIRVIGAAMIVFPFLESVFAFCVGCKLYGLLARGGVVSADLCVDCALPARR